MQPSLLPPMAGFVGPQAKLILVSSYVWNPGTFNFSKIRNPNQADQPCILHNPGINGIIRAEKATLTCTDLLHQHVAFTHLLQPTTSIPLVQRIWEKILPSLDQGRIVTKRGATRLTAMAILTCELWQDWCSVTLSALWSHNCEGSKKNFCHSFSLWPAGTAEKLPFKSCSLIT